MPRQKAGRSLVADSPPTRLEPTAAWCETGRRTTTWTESPPPPPWTTEGSALQGWSSLAVAVCHSHVRVWLTVAYHGCLPVTCLVDCGDIIAVCQSRVWLTVAMVWLSASHVSG